MTPEERIARIQASIGKVSERIEEKRQAAEQKPEPRKPPPSDSPAYRAEYRKRQHARMVAGEVNPPHGRASTYDNYACRCDLCREAAIRARRESRERQKHA